MRRAITLFYLFLATAFLNSAADEISARARKLQSSSIVLDTHDDTTQHFFSKDFDFGKSNRDGSIDIPRMKEGGMNAIFFPFGSTAASWGRQRSKRP